MSFLQAHFMVPQNPQLTQQEKDGSVRLRNSVIPCRTLKKSNFLKIYDATKRSPTYQDLKNHTIKSSHTDLQKCYEEATSSFTGKPSKILGATCVQFWTREDVGGFYKKVNAALLSDHSELLSNWMWLIRALNRFLVDTRSVNAMTTYRKSDLDQQQASKIKVGKTYRMGMYTATSTDKSFTESWHRGSGTYHWEFNIPKDCYNACFIKKWSYLQNESEVLLPPYSSVKIKSIKNGYIHADVLDNLNVALDVPTIIA